MKSSEFIVERKSTEAEIRQRGWTGDDQDKEWFDYDVPNGKASTHFTVIDTLSNILGRDNLIVDDEQDTVEFHPGLIMVNTGSPTVGYGGGRFFQHGDTAAEGVEINLSCDADSYNAEDIAAAAHEAFHAKISKGAAGSLYRNEKLVNKMAEKWLRSHLSGIPLHVALSAINASRINYRKDEL